MFPQLTTKKKLLPQFSPQLVYYCCFAYHHLGGAARYNLQAQPKAASLLISTKHPVRPATLGEIRGIDCNALSTHHPTPCVQVAMCFIPIRAHAINYRWAPPVSMQKRRHTISFLFSHATMRWASAAFVRSIVAALQILNNTQPWEAHVSNAHVRLLVASPLMPTLNSGALGTRPTTIWFEVVVLRGAVR